MFCKIHLIGRVGREPERKTFQNGDEIANLSVATTEKWRGKDGATKEHTEWNRVLVYRGLVKSVTRVKKGDLVYIEGQLRTRKWDKNGQEKTVTEIHCTVFRLLGNSKRDEGHSSGKQSEQQNLSDEKPKDYFFDDEDIPF